MTTTEQEIRSRLTIPESDTARYVLIVDAAAHMDWDWQETFADYYQDKAKPILATALRLLGQNQPPGPGPFYYSICEMGFLKRFVEDVGSSAVEEACRFERPNGPAHLRFGQPKVRSVG